MSGSFQSIVWLGWVKALPDEMVRARPVLSVGYAWSLLNYGELEAGEARLRDAERWMDSATDKREHPEGPSDGMVVVDEVVAEKKIAAFAAPTGVGSFHLHPDVEVEQVGEREVRLRLKEGQVVRFSTDTSDMILEDSTWHPEFGLSIPSKVIRCRFEEGRQECRLSWGSV